MAWTAPRRRWTRWARPAIWWKSAASCARAPAARRPALARGRGSARRQRRPRAGAALRDLSIATSGDYRRHAGSGDARYAHTIDPRDGQPVRNGVASVTVLHADCMQADALATALTVLGETEGLDLARRHGLAALFILREAAASGSPPPGVPGAGRAILSAMTLRLTATAGVVLLAAAMRLGLAPRARARETRQALDQPPPRAAVLVAHASQTGCAETLAGQTADSLRAGGLDVRIAALGQLDLARLRGYERVLFVASTYGEGDPPDAAAAFASLMQPAAAGTAPQLPGLRYAVLALGDSEYAQFCGFGRALDEWLRAQGAQPLFDRVDVDNGDAAALRHWQHHLGLLAGRGDLPDWETPAYEPWRLQGRERLNPDSQGGPCYLLTLAPPSGAALSGRPATLPRSAAPRTRRGTAAAPRILDRIPTRRRRCIAGAPDARARWRPGPGQRMADARGAAGRRDRSQAAVQSHHAPDDDRPMILIGNGTGLAGLRALLKAPGGGPPPQLAGVRRAPGRA